jgi:hypothetical protein
MNGILRFFGCLYFPLCVHVCCSQFCYLLSSLVVSGSIKRLLDAILLDPPGRISPWWLPYTVAVFVEAARCRGLCSRFAFEQRQWCMSM